MKLLAALALALCACAAPVSSESANVCHSDVPQATDTRTVVRVVPIDHGFSSVLASQTCPPGSSLLAGHCDATCGASVTRSASVPDGWQCGAEGSGGEVVITVECANGT